MAVRSQRTELHHSTKASLAIQNAKSDQPQPFKIVNKGGRPLTWTDEKIEEEIEALYEWLENPRNYYLASFLNSRGLLREHASRFEKRHEGFRDAFNLARQIQEQRLVDLAVTKKGDGNFIKFMLVAREGWKDESTVNHNLNPLASLLERISQSKSEPIDVTPPSIEPTSLEPSKIDYGIVAQDLIK